MTPPAACPEPARLADLLGGRLPFADAERLADHLEGCPACGRVAEGLDVDDGLAAELRGSIPLPPPDGPRLAALIDTLCRLDTPAPARAAWDADRALRPPDHPGDLGRVGPYRVLGRLGAGGMGVVYRARQARPARTVALKVLRADPGADPDRTARFRAEADAAARLAHPNIVPVYDAGEDGGVAYLAMELVEGEALAGRLAAAPLAPRPAAELVAAVARAVGYAHANGVVHRDLKPSNVLLARDGTPKVSDFGLAKVLDAGRAGLTATGAVLGTPEYMAPEQAAGGPAVGPAADVYGLGAILYECLTARPPFTAATPLETLDQVRGRDPVPPARLQPGTPRDLQTVCLKCLEKKPADRYATAAALADDLDRFIRGEPVTARPAGPLRRAWAWARRRPTAAALVAVSAAAAVSLVAVVAVYTARLQTAVDRANTNAGAAQRQAERAAAHYRSGRDALRQMLRRFDGRPAADVPRLMELRRDQLEDALAFYDGILADLDDPDPEVRFDAALARVDAAVVQYALGQRGPALERCRAAVAHLEQLPGDYRARPACRLALITGFNHLADAAAGQQRWNEGEAFYRKAVAEAEAFRAADPAAPARHESLASAVHNLAVLYQLRGQYPAAESQYARAIEVREGLVARHPGTPGFRMGLAESLLNLGHVRGNLNRPAEAEEAYRRADDLLRPLADEHPANSAFTLSLAGVHVNWGNLLRARGDLTAALGKFDRAVTLADAAVAREPRLAVARQRALEAHGSRAVALDQGGRYAAAVVDFDRVVEYADESMRTRYRLDLLGLLAAVGMHARVSAEARDLARAPGLSDDASYSLARTLTRAAGRGRLDAAIGVPAGAAAAEECHAAAVGLLRRLHAAGYFRTPERANRLTTDADLAPLRGRADFQRLLADAAGATAP